jgi:DNA repair exonuclease SbcCD ATPase subunit
MAATVERETAEEEANKAQSEKLQADKKAATALKQENDADLDVNRVDMTIDQDKKIVDGAKSDRSTREALVAEKGAAVDATNAAVAKAKSEYEAKVNAHISAKSELEAAQKAGTDLRAAKGPAADVAAADVKTTAAIARVRFAASAKEEASKLLDAKEEELDDLQEQLREAKAEFAKANIVLQTTSSLLDNAEGQKAVLEQEAEDAATKSQQATLLQASVNSAAGIAKAKLDNAVEQEQQLSAKQLKENREKLAAQWDTNYQSLEAKMNTIDEKFQAFKDCVKDGKWICDVPA